MEPMAKVKVEPDDYFGETGAPNPLATKAKEKHLHSIKWTAPNKHTYYVTCYCKGTITNVLMRTAAFEELASTNKNKELVILREGRAISTHFPCNLITNKPILIKYIKNEKNVEKIQNESKVDSPSIGNQSGKVIVFHLCTSGGENIKMILKNLEIKSIINELTVYAYEGETVEDALHRDGRFNDSVFEKNCGLIQLDTEEICEFSNVVCHIINDKRFKISVKPTTKKKTDSQESQLGSSGEAGTGNEGDQDLSQLPPTTETENDSPTNKKLKQNESEAPLNSMHEIPKSEEIRRDLFQELISAMEALKINVKGTNTFARIQEHLRVEYAKNDERCKEVKVMKKLMKCSDSVCLVAIDGKEVGTGFLFFDRFVLTNCHVVKGVVGQSPLENVSVYFEYEEFSSESLKGVKAEEVVAYRYNTDESGNSYDWALLKLEQTAGVSCSCLLEHFGYLPPTGGLCIIGHPDCGVKKVDPCYIIPATDYNKVVTKHKKNNQKGAKGGAQDSKQYGAGGRTQWVGPKFFDGVKNEIAGKNPIVSYNTCFHFGSSGSPVFDYNCNVIAIHTGGYAYLNEKKERQSIIDYGYLLSNIIEDIIVELVDKKSWNVLKKYLSFEYKEKENIRDGVKTLTKSKGFTGFHDALQSDEVTKDENLKDFFDFICQEEEQGKEV